MRRWRNGYVAVGSPDVGNTPVWVSADGASWAPLGGDVFGPSALVLGIGESAVGLVALTIETRQDLPGSWPPGTPVRAWTSPDGATWTSRTGPAIVLPEDRPVFAAGPAGVVIVATRAQSPDEAGRIAISNDGLTWELLPADTLPKGVFMEAIEPLSSGFVAVGNALSGPGSPATALTSVDGRTWTSHTIQESTATASRVVSRLAVGSTGVIAMGEQYAGATEGETGSAASIAIWWSSLDGRAWDVQPNYPPLGPQLGPDAQECFDACPDRDLVGDGERLLAYRGGPGGHAWTSFDGRSWTKLATTGDQVAAPDHPTTMIVLPIGILKVPSDSGEGDEPAWFGTPSD